MKFRKLVLMSFLGGVSIVVTDGCDRSLNGRIENTLSAFTASKNATGTRPFDFWCLNQGISQLQNTQDAIRTNGVIYYAVYSTTEGAVTKRFDLGYLSKDADVSEIRFLKDGVVIGRQKSICREIWKTCEKHVVGFNEVCRWDNRTDPIKTYSVKDLMVEIVKENGSIIGPAPILTDKEVWEEVKRKIFAEPEWQAKFPILSNKLHKTPNMSPMWSEK